jgi:ATP/ADP translocase
MDKVLIQLIHTSTLQTKFYVDRRILKTQEGAAAEAAATKKSKPKGNWKDTLQTLKESPKIMNLALLVVCYAVSHRLFEFAWKGQLRVLFPTAQAYSGALAEVSIYTGAPAPLCVLHRSQGFILCVPYTQKYAHCCVSEW